MGSACIIRNSSNQQSSGAKIWICQHLGLLRQCLTDHSYIQNKVLLIIYASGTDSCLLVCFCSITVLFAGAVGQSVNRKNGQGGVKDATFIQIFTQLYPILCEQGHNCTALQPLLRGVTSAWCFFQDTAIGLTQHLTWDTITEFTHTTELLCHHENQSELHHFKASQPSLRMFLWHLRDTSIPNTVFEYKIMSPITHTLADIQAIEKQEQLVLTGLPVWASELLTIIQKVVKLYLWLLHKIQTRPLFTLGFQAVGVATYITKFHTTFFMGNQVEKLIYRINLSKLAKQKMCQLGLRVLCQFYTIFYHSEYFWCPSYKTGMLMQVNLPWTL